MTHLCVPPLHRALQVQDSGITSHLHQEDMDTSISSSPEVPKTASAAPLQAAALPEPTASEAGAMQAPVPASKATPAPAPWTTRAETSQQHSTQLPTSPVTPAPTRRSARLQSALAQPSCFYVLCWYILVLFYSMFPRSFVISLLLHPIIACCAFTEH